MLSEEVKTVRIKSTHPPSQGEFVEINETDYDSAIHQLYQEEPAKRGPGRPRRTEPLT